MVDQRHNEYPDGIDCLWVASDSFGNVGAFVTAGMAPIPAIALSVEYGDILDVGEKVMELPSISRVAFGQNDPHLADFYELAERGVFAFDWSDIHRADVECLGGYEKVASPTSPLKAEELQGFLGKCTSLLRLAGVNFANEGIVEVELLTGSVCYPKHIL